MKIKDIEMKCVYKEVLPETTSDLQLYFELQSIASLEECVCLYDSIKDTTYFEIQGKAMICNTIREFYSDDLESLKETARLNFNVAEFTDIVVRDESQLVLEGHTKGMCTFEVCKDLNDGSVWAYTHDAIIWK